MPRWHCRPLHGRVQPPLARWQPAQALHSENWWRARGQERGAGSTCALPPPSPTPPTITHIRSQIFVEEGQRWLTEHMSAAQLPNSASVRSRPLHSGIAAAVPACVDTATHMRSSLCGAGSSCIRASAHPSRPHPRHRAALSPILRRPRPRPPPAPFVPRHHALLVRGACLPAPGIMLSPSVCALVCPAVVWRGRARRSTTWSGPTRCASRTRPSSSSSAARRDQSSVQVCTTGSRSAAHLPRRQCHRRI